MKLISTTDRTLAKSVGFIPRVQLIKSPVKSIFLMFTFLGQGEGFLSKESPVIGWTFFVNSTPTNVVKRVSVCFCREKWNEVDEQTHKHTAATMLISLASYQLSPIVLSLFATCCLNLLFFYLNFLWSNNHWLCQRQWRVESSGCVTSPVWNKK